MFSRHGTLGVRTDRIRNLAAHLVIPGFGSSERRVLLRKVTTRGQVQGQVVLGVGRYKSSPGMVDATLLGAAKENPTRLAQVEPIPS